jgi:hypothetical protein
MANISTVAPYADAGSAETSAQAGFFRRVFAAIIESQQRRADREIAAILARYADTPRYVLDAERALARRNYPMGQVR